MLFIFFPVPPSDWGLRKWNRQIGLNWLHLQCSFISASYGVWPKFLSCDCLDGRAAVHNTSLVSKNVLKVARTYLYEHWLYFWSAFFGKTDLTDFYDFCILNKEWSNFKKILLFKNFHSSELTCLCPSLFETYLNNAKYSIYEKLSRVFRVVGFRFEEK